MIQVAAARPDKQTRLLWYWRKVLSVGAISLLHCAQLYLLAPRKRKPRLFLHCSLFNSKCGNIMREFDTHCTAECVLLGIRFMWGAQLTVIDAGCFWLYWSASITRCNLIVFFLCYCRVNITITSITTHKRIIAHLIHPPRNDKLEAKQN